MTPDEIDQMLTIHYSRWDRFVYAITGRWPERIVIARLTAVAKAEALIRLRHEEREMRA